ncbi:MAG: hypothetical protein PHU95_02210 [Candidatus Thermoplasmatota archaeon]|nr:hypothetical protein [Candidatus Thermoplasmatota archaeon]MDD5778245.1 hypothetical protein [Candidatus Thermoplasmatota archaeon]
MPKKGWCSVTIRTELAHRIDTLARPGEQRPGVIARALDALEEKT